MDEFISQFQRKSKH